MTDGINLSLVDFDDKETIGEIGSAIKEALSAEGKGKWVGTSSVWLGTKAAEAIDDAVGGLDVLALFGAAWATSRDLQDRANPEKYPPNKPQYVKLGKHTVNFDVKPSLMVSVGPWSSAPIEIVMALSAIINAMELKIRNGHIESIHGGQCDIGMTLKLAGREVMKRKTLKVFELDAEHVFSAPGLRLSVREVDTSQPAEAAPAKA